MNEWSIYIALNCVLLYTQSALQSCGGSHMDDATAATTLTTHQLQVERRESHRDNQVYVLTTHQLQVERRERQSQSSGWGWLRGHDWQGPVVGIWPNHRGYTPTLYEKFHGIFNDHRESGPQFNISSERRCFFGSVVSPSLYLGFRTHTDHRVSTPCWPH